MVHKEKFATAWMQGIKQFGLISIAIIESARSLSRRGYDYQQVDYLIAGKYCVMSICCL